MEADRNATDGYLQGFEERRAVQPVGNDVGRASLSACRRDALYMQRNWKAPLPMSLP